MRRWLIAIAAACSSPASPPDLPPVPAPRPAPMAVAVPRDAGLPPDDAGPAIDAAVAEPPTFVAHVDVIPANGALDRRINRKIASRQSVYRACYQGALQRDPSLAGTLVAHITVNDKGAMTDATRVTSTFKDDSVVSCTLANLRALAFSPGPAISAEYAFVFSKTTGGGW